ncbi:hypothetical protein KUL25_03280 [Rhodobacteraceae bacterium N5(2021)]|uniref:Uncharacterized protein n=1 Tax=Gymnodinialimonas phycosphaerae TaxID=2841589 RepID=A0A975TW57_9RHOB|nr:hypothetical protein [Gymnodinialimonas phycosphaerae]MBY4891785.1 hypothetical protein [Gymnodinialimonas phycosphaerae]
MKTEPKTFRDGIRTAARLYACKCSLYCQLSGWYGYVAYVTGKPEVYLPGLILHALLAWASRH